MSITDILRMICLVSLVSGCAMGNQYDYRMANLPMSVEGKSKIGVSVEDARPYVTNGSKPSNFIGLQRGGFGNPFNVTTESGRSLAVDMQESLTRSLAARGFNAIPLSMNPGDIAGIAQAAQKDGLLRVAVLEIKEWKSDAMMRLTMHHDLVLSVYDVTGSLLAEARSARSDAIGGAGFESSNAAAARGEFERVVGGLFEHAEVKKALQDMP